MTLTMTKREQLVYIHLTLSEHDPKMLTSPDGERIEVAIEAIRALVYGEETKND